MKKLLSVILCLSLLAASALVFTGCGKQNKGKETADDIENTVEIDGGWTRTGSPVITDDLKKAFEKAVSELDGVDYTPVAYLASQVVAGTNHCVLCKAAPVVPDAETTYSIVYIYEDLEGNAEITEIVSSRADAQNAEENIPGGWTETGSPEMTDDARTALEKACETLTGAEYTPLALLATQVVAGTNYRIVCESRPSVPFPECGYVIVTVYADLEGNAEIIDTTEFRHKDIYADTDTGGAADTALPVPNADGSGAASAGSGTDGTDIRTDVCELYLLVLEDLWNVDPGLNDGISQIGIDLSELSHLTEPEKETVMNGFASKHDLPFIAGTWEELCDQGYIDKDNLYWEDGLFFSIKTTKTTSKLTVFDAQKWRSGKGAYFFGQCTAKESRDGTWSYTVGQEAIS